MPSRRHSSPARPSVLLMEIPEQYDMRDGVSYSVSSWDLPEIGKPVRGLYGAYVHAGAFILRKTALVSCAVGNGDALVACRMTRQCKVYP